MTTRKKFEEMADARVDQDCYCNELGQGYDDKCEACEEKFNLTREYIQVHNGAVEECLTTVLAAGCDCHGCKSNRKALEALKVEP